MVPKVTMSAMGEDGPGVPSKVLYPVRYCIVLYCTGKGKFDVRDAKRPHQRGPKTCGSTLGSTVVSR